jgi:hypothetical protein
LLIKTEVDPSVVKLFESEVEVEFAGDYVVDIEFVAVTADIRLKLILVVEDPPLVSVNVITIE